mgnify:CR=1 FL=1
MPDIDNTCAGADPAPRAPKHLPPPGACDCHAHIFGPANQYPYCRKRKYTPPDASLAAYCHMLKTLGLSRGVIVQPSVYGFDNRATLDAVKAGKGNFKGVVVIDPEVISDGELDHMHHIGVRGVRINQAYDEALDMKYLHKVVERIRRLGWHLQLFVNLNRFPDFKRHLIELPVDVVIDHMGFIDVAKGLSNQQFQDLLALLETGKCWVKLSGAYRISVQTKAPYSDATPFAKALVKANPDRCVWATDWPHPHLNIPVPNDGDLLDLLSLWVPDEKLRNRILIDNPANLYGFSAIDAGR